MHSRNKGRYYTKSFTEPEAVYKNRLVGKIKMRKRLDKIPHNSWVFVSDMGDLFCQNDTIKKDDIEWVINTMLTREDVSYLLVTKNPSGYLNFSKFPKNAYLGTTIETDSADISAKYSDAPTPYKRYRAMLSLSHPRKFVGLEPLFDFDVEPFSKWLVEINPDIVAVGFDEHENTMKHTKNDRPSKTKILKLLSNLKKGLDENATIYLTGEVADLYFGGHSGKKCFK